MIVGLGILKGQGERVLGLGLDIILLPDLRLIEARRVVCVGELGRAPGQDLVDGQAADVVLTQEPVQHVIIHGRAGPAPGLGPKQGYL